MIRLPFAVLLLLGFLPSADAAIIMIANPEQIAPHADLVVRGVLDHDAREVRILEEWGEKTGRPSIRVGNLERFGGIGSPFERQALTEWPTQAFLFLARLDGRYWLVDVGNPDWVPAHSSILYVDGKNRICRFMQPINPGGLVLTPTKETADAFAARVEVWIRERPARPARRPDLAGKDADDFYAILDGWLDFYTRTVTKEPRAGALAELVSSLAAFAREREGEPRRRAIEALLILAERQGPEEPPRLAAALAALVALLDDLGPEPFVAPCHAELASEDIFSAKKTAGRILVRIGGEPLERGKEILAGQVRIEEGNLATRAYWALIYMGFEDLAKAANGEK